MITLIKSLILGALIYVNVLMLSLIATVIL